MRVLETLPRDAFSQPCALTIGTFDGVHRGHAALVARLRKEAASRNLPTAVFTFQDMPYCYFKPEECSRLLTLPDEKIAAFAPLAIDTLLIVPFDAKIAEQSADDFVNRVLVELLNVKLLVIGPDFALGKGRSGDVNSLRTLGEKYGFETIVLTEKIEDEGPISSTRIRECVEDGHMKTASRLLGRAFEISGNVVSGQQIGRTIGVPTINLQIHARKVRPANGVYACFAQLDETKISAEKLDFANTNEMQTGISENIASKNNANESGATKFDATEIDKFGSDEAKSQSAKFGATEIFRATESGKSANETEFDAPKIGFEKSDSIELEELKFGASEIDSAKSGDSHSDAMRRESSTRKRAALNIGNRPTVGGQNVSIEFHVIGEEIPTAPSNARLQIVERLRDERKFSGLPALVEQMQLDISRADAILRDES